MCCIIGTNKDKGNVSETKDNFKCSCKRCVGESYQEERVKTDKHESKYR